MDRRIVLLTVIAVIGVSFGSIIIRFSDAQPLLIALWRLLIASLLLWPLALRNKNRPFLSLGKKDFLLVLFAGVALAMHFYLWITSVFLTTVANSTVLVSTQVLFVALGEWIFLRRRYSRTFFLSLSLALAGIVLIANADFRIQSGPALSGDFLALGGAVMAAAYFYLGGVLRARLPVEVYGSLVYSAAAIFLAALILVLGLNFLDFSPINWLYFLLLALVPQLLGHTVLNYLLAKVRPVFITLAVLGEPVGATLWAFLFFKEAPGPLALLGGVLVVIALAIVPKGQMVIPE